MASVASSGTALLEHIDVEVSWHGVVVRHRILDRGAIASGGTKSSTPNWSITMSRSSNSSIRSTNSQMCIALLRVPMLASVDVHATST